MGRQLRIPATDVPLSKRIDNACASIQRAIDLYRPSTKFVAFSGGYDSLTVTHLCMEHFDFDAVLHIDTGIGLQDTRDFVEYVCESRGWDLTVYAADEYVRGDGQPDPQIWEELIVPPEVRRGELTWLERGGFPGPTETGHGKMFDRLKGRPVTQCVREHKQSVPGPASTMSAAKWLSRHDWPIPYKKQARQKLISEVKSELDYIEGVRSERHDRILMVSGIYADESSRRFQLKSSRHIDRDGAQLWCNPCMDWTTEDMQAYRKEYRLHLLENPVYAVLGMSGECLCSAFSKPGEKGRIGEADECMYRRICAAEQLADDHGYCWGYEQGPPDEVVEAKNMLREDDDGQVELSLAEANMCHSCGAGYWQMFDVEQRRKAWAKQQGREKIRERINDAICEIRAREAS